MILLLKFPQNREQYLNMYVTGYMLVFKLNITKFADHIKRRKKNQSASLQL